MAKVQRHHSDTKVISATKNCEIDPSPRTPFGCAPWAEAVVSADECLHIPVWGGVIELGVGVRRNRIIRIRDLGTYRR